MNEEEPIEPTRCEKVCLLVMLALTAISGILHFMGIIG